MKLTSILYSGIHNLFFFIPRGTAVRAEQWKKKWKPVFFAPTFSFCWGPLGERRAKMKKKLFSFPMLWPAAGQQWEQMEKNTHSGKHGCCLFWVAQEPSQVTSDQCWRRMRAEEWKKKQNRQLFSFCPRVDWKERKKWEAFSFSNFFIALPGRLEERNEKRFWIPLYFNVRNFDVRHFDTRHKH